MKRKLINRLALLCVILSLMAGNMQAVIRTVNTETFDASLPGSLPYEFAQLQDGDILTFDRAEVNTITLNNTPRTSKSVTIRGNGVTIKVETSNSSSSYYVELSVGGRVENVNWEATLLAHSSSRIINCTFKPFFTEESSLLCFGGDYYIEGCAFLTEGDKVAWIENGNKDCRIHLISCTLINETNEENHKTFIKQNGTSSKTNRHVTFTNCVLLDPGATDTSPSVSLYNITSKGYNVFQGIMIPNAAAAPAWTPLESDIIVLHDATQEDLPLTYNEDIYKVTSGKAAYRHLPTNPNATIAALADVSFPEKDLSGNVIDYNTRNTHSGAWQTVYGDDDDDSEVVVTDITVDFPANGILFTDTVWHFQAAVFSEGSNATQEVTWECTTPNVTITPSEDTGPGTLYAAFYAEGLTEDTPITVTLTAKESGADGQPFTKDFQLTLKPYVHVGAILLPDLDITFGYERGLRPTVLPVDANWKEVEWTVVNPAVASVTVHPGTDSITVKGLTEGTTSVIATAKDNSVFNTLTVTVNRPDYSEGVFIVNEDWFGHLPGSVNFLYNDGRIDYNVFKHANHTPYYSLGVTTQYGAIYSDKFYLISKQGTRLAVVDARTMELHKGFLNLGGDGRSFFGVDEHTGYVGTDKGLLVVNLDELPNIPGDYVKSGLVNVDPKLVITQPGTSIAALQTAGSALTGQVTTMKRVGESVFVLKQGNLHVINAATHNVEATLNDHHYVSMTQSKDGYLWLGTSGTVPTGGTWNPQEDEWTDGELTNYFVRLDPWTLERKVVTLPNGINGVVSTYGAWQADAFLGSAQDNVIYWKSNSLRILRYDIETNRVDTVLDLRNMPFLPGVEAPWTLYGTSFAVDHRTGELVVTAGTFMITCCVKDRNNWKILRVNPNGGQPRADEQGNIGNIISEHPLEKNYWFPAMPVFPDKYRPEFTDVPFPDAVTLSATHPVDSLGLLDKVNDADNMRAAMVTTVLDSYNKQLVNAFVWRDTLVVAARKTISAGQPAESTVVTLKFNSNGRVITKEIPVTINPSAPVYPFELNAHALTLMLNVNPSAQLSLVHPEEYPDLTWHSENDDIATVAAGTVTAVAEGTVWIFAEAPATNSADSCAVTVLMPTGIAQTAALNAAAGYSNGALRLYNLEGYNCRITSVSGQLLETFTATSGEENRPVSLPSGVYILTAQKDSERLIFKFVVF
jgi:hypothetical protein